MTTLSRDTRATLFLLACASFVSGATMRVAEPLLPRVAEEFHTGVAAAGVIASMFTLAYGVFQLVYGPLGDRIGRIRVVVVALFLAAACSVGCALSGSLATLALFRFLTGMTTAAVIPLGMTFVADRVPFENRQAVLGRFISGVLLGQTFGPLLGGVFIDTVGWRGAFAVLALCYGLMGALLVSRARAEPRPEPRNLHVLAEYLQLLRSPWVRRVIATVACASGTYFGALAYTGAYLQHEFALDYTVIGLLLAGFGIGGLLYSLMVKQLLGWLGERGMVAWGGAVLFVSFVALVLVPVWWLVGPLMVVSGYGFYMLHNTLQTRATEMAPQARGSAIAVFAFCMFIGQSLGALLLGHAVERWGYALPLSAAGVTIYVIALAFRQALWTHGREVGARA